MKKILIAIVLLTSTTSFSSPADSSRFSEIESVIEQLFNAMREGDSTAARAVFHDEARLMSTNETKDGTQIHSEKIAGFIEAIGTPHDQLWDERISNLVIQVDGVLAQAWMDYEFYVDDNFSHCGVNAMQFVYEKESWKMIQIMDTRRRKNCN